MQLIVETETTLDIERNMSAVDNLQNNKVENIDIEDLNNKKCNGNNEVIETVDDEGSKQVINEIEGALTNIPRNVENNEAELSNVDLSEIIREQKSLEAEETKNAESQNGEEKNTNGVDTTATETNEPKEVLEEDYLEDDIISISEGPFSEISEQQKELGNGALDKNETSIKKESPEDEEDKVEIVEPTNNTSVEDDVIELIEEVESPVPQCEDKTETQIQKETDPTKELQKNEKLPECQKEPQLDESEVMAEKSPTPCEIEMEPDKLESTVKAEVSSIIGKDEINSLTTDSKLNDVMIIEETNANKIDSTKRGREKVQTKVLEEINENVIQTNQTHSVTDEVKKNKALPEDEPNSPREEKDEVEVIEETEEPAADLPEKVIPNSNVTDCKENGSNVTNSETSKCQSTPIILKDKDVMDVEDVVQETQKITETADSPIELKDDMDVEEVIEESTSNKKVPSEVKESTPVNTASVNSIIDKPIICKLSNTLDILSDDDDEELPKVDVKTISPKTASNKEKQCIDIEDDDDIMLIDEDKTETNAPVDIINKQETVGQSEVNVNAETGEKIVRETNDELFDKDDDKKETTPPPVPDIKESNMEIDIKEKTPDTKLDELAPPTPLIPENFVKTAKKKLSDMTRDELEEFCILKIVESIVDRSSLSDIKNKIKTITQGLEEYRKKAMMLTKQNRDLQVVLKSVQEEQKKVSGNTPITPLKITRSVGMQVYMEKTVPRKKGQPPNAVNNKNPNIPQNKNINAQGQGPRQQKQINQNIPVPRLVPANNPGLKTPSTIPQMKQMNTPNKNPTPPNGILKNPSPIMKAEKRQHSKIASSVTVDLTDDEPPSKMPGGPKSSPAPPVRLVSPQNLMGPQRQAFGPGVNSPRKVYIPISGPQNQALRPGQTIMLKTVPAAGMRPRCPTQQVNRMESNAVRMNRIAPRHPAPLPLTMKQSLAPTWKSLPPAPDLKLSKVENGIVISWKIEGVPEDTYEEIASYQLYAYQETSQPPSTALWKKIGDVKALPLPMACTLTQFMAGFKYYFAVRAVDVRSRFGPFSLPGSILLLSKNI